MSLLAVHIVMVVSAIVFSVGFAVREVALARGGSSVAAVFAAFSALAALGLAVYLRWLLRTKGRRIRAASSRPPRRDH
jgi:hypothetical protein